MLKILDVSYHNGKVDWAKVKAAGYNAAILRAGFGLNTVDERFHENARGALAAGLKIGIYWFSYAVSAAQGKQEAEFCLKTIKDYKITLPVFHDYEYDSADYSRRHGVTPTKRLVTSITRAFCDTVKAAGYKPGYYANLDYKNNMYDSAQLSDCIFWYARYLGHLDGTTCDLYQYTSKGSCPGINGPVDISYLYNENLLSGKTEKKTAAKKTTKKKAATTKTVTKNATFGSARIDENGHISGGKRGDQTGREVMTEPYYLHSSGWICYRAKDKDTARKLARAMKYACLNDHIGYSQSDRNSLYKTAEKISFKTKYVTTNCNCDCSSLVRVCLAYAGIQTPDFNTATEPAILEKTGKFTKITNVSVSNLQPGDILVTRRQGHTGIITATTTATVTAPKKTATSGKTTLQLVYETMTGKHGDGDDRKAALGSRYQEVQAFINHIATAGTATLAAETKAGRYGNGDVRKAVLGRRYAAVQNVINGK